MSSHTIHVFISHSWSNARHYDTLERWIFGRTWRFGQASLSMKNYSIPRDDPYPRSNRQALRQTIGRHIARSHVVVVPTGVYATHSDWIRSELALAADYRKPVLAVVPRGQIRNSSTVQARADEIVGWTARSVVASIWEMFRDEWKE